MLKQGIVCIAGCLLATPTAADYELTRAAVTNGGTSQATAGNHTLGSTIGQPASATSQGGGYTLVTGFWSRDLPRPDAMFSNSFEATP